MGEQRAAARARIGGGSRRGNRGIEATDREDGEGRRTAANGRRPTEGGRGRLQAAVARARARAG